MKSWGWVALTLLVFSTVLKAQVDMLKRAKPLEFALHKVDLSLLVNEARNRGLGVSGKELETRVVSSFRFIFLNRVNHSNFATAPNPKYVIDKMIHILRLDGRLEHLVREGRRLVEAIDSGEERETLVRDVAGSASQLNKTFRRYFLDFRDSPYRITLRENDAKDVQFVHYMVQLDRLGMLLRQELDHYFFNPAPGEVDLSEYDDFSISTLSKSMIKLSSMTERKLQP